MTEEQNKLAEEIEAMRPRYVDAAVGNRVEYPATELDALLARAAAALREREPATEAVLGTMSEVTAPVIAAPGAFNLSEFVNAADIGGADSPHQVVYKLQRAINATLQGKGASQGAEGPIDMMAELKNRLAAPEPPGEFVRVPREPTEAQRHLAMMNDSPSYRKNSLTFYREMLAAACPDEQKG